LSTSFPDGAGAILEQSGPSSPTDKIFGFLQNLAKQRGLLMGQTPQGDLLFRKPNIKGDVVAELIEGHQGVLISTASYDGTKRFSSYDVFGQESGKNDNFAQLLAEISKKPVASESQSITDPSVFAIRPKSISANDTNQGNIEDAARRALTSDIAASINIPLGYEGWLRPDGALWRENDLILVHAPSIMVYKPFVLRIKTVVFSSDEDSKTTNFTLTIPEAYTDTIPTRFPWDE
jgi:prophage tail gpP-like protein